MKKVLAALVCSFALVFALPVAVSAVTNDTSAVINPADPQDAPKVDSIGGVTVTDNGTAELTSAKPLLSGYAVPFSIINIEIHSNVIYGTTTADATGYWSWTPPTAIEAGNHTVQVVAKDEAGHISMQKTYKVAVSTEVAAAKGGQVAGASTAAKTTSWVTYAIWGLVVLFVLVAGFAVAKRRSSED